MIDNVMGKIKLVKNSDLSNTASIGLLFKSAKQDFSTRLIEKLKQSGYQDFTPPHLYVLGTIIREDGIRLTTIAEKLCISKQSIKEIIDCFEEKKYIQRTTDLIDSRAKNVNLTDLGKKLSEDAKKAAEEIKAEYISILGEEEFKQLENSIKLIINHGIR